MNCINNPWIGCFSLDNGHIPTPFKLLSSTHFTKCPNINNVSLYKLDFVITKCELSNLFAVSNNFLISETMDGTENGSNISPKECEYEWWAISFHGISLVLSSFYIRSSSILQHSSVVSTEFLFVTHPLPLWQSNVQDICFVIAKIPQNEIVLSPEVRWNEIIDSNWSCHMACLP